jgi:hypothetical protein
MGIRSTQYVSREQAIERIVLIDSLATEKRYRTLESETFDTDHDLNEFVDEYVPQSYTADMLEEWTNTMLTDKLDKPFFRTTMFDNYLIGERDA